MSNDDIIAVALKHLPSPYKYDGDTFVVEVPRPLKLPPLNFDEPMSATAPYEPPFTVWFKKRYRGVVREWFFDFIK